MNLTLVTQLQIPLLLLLSPKYQIPNTNTDTNINTDTTFSSNEPDTGHWSLSCKKTFSSLAPFQFSHSVMLCSALVRVPKIMDAIFLSLFGIESKGDIEDTIPQANMLPKANTPRSEKRLAQANTIT